jgi:hypothetical protein
MNNGVKQKYGHVQVVPTDLRRPASDLRHRTIEPLSSRSLGEIDTLQAPPSLLRLVTHCSNR